MAILHDRKDKQHISKELSLGEDAELVMRAASGAEVSASFDELKNLDRSGGGKIAALTASGAVTGAPELVTLSHPTVVIAATIADASNLQGLFIVKNTSASGTAAHTLTLTSGTFDGTNSVATLNAPGEALVVYFDGSGNGTIVENVGAVALS